MKWWGFFLLLSGGAGLGWVKAASFTGRVRAIEQLQTAMQLLETELLYTLAPLPMVLQSLSQRIANPVGVLFGQVAERMTEQQQTTEQAWRLAVQAICRTDLYSTQAQQVLLDFGAGLAQGAAEDLQKQFALLYTRLQQLHQEALQQRSQQQRLWRYLGICVSAMIGLVLF